MSNVERYLENKLKFEFTTFKEFDKKFHNHKDFNKVFKGDMFVYDE